MKIANLNIRKIYAFNFFWLFIVLMPLLYRYYTSLGITIPQFFQLQAIFAFTVGILDIPTGYFSDRFGRKASLCAGTAFSAAGYFVLLYANEFWGLALHEFLLGVALAFISGTDIAILYDSLPENSSRAETSSALGKTQFFYALGDASGAIVSMFLVAISMHFLLVVQVIISWIPLIVALTLAEPNHKRREAPSLASIMTIWRHLLHGDALLRLLAINFVSNMLISFVVIWMMQNYLQENHIPPFWFGGLWAFFTITVGLTSHFTTALEKYWTANKLILAIPILCTVSYFLMGYLPGYWGLAAGLLVYIARGLNNVVYRDILNWRVASELRATANSIFSFLFRMGFVIAGPIVGYSIGEFGLRPTFYGVGAVSLLLCLLCTYPLARKIKDIKF